MERDEFLKSFGFGLALVCTGACFEACKKDSNTITEPPPTGGSGNKVTVDLSSQLQNVGDQVRMQAQNILFFRIAAGNAATSFVATEAICPHQAGNLVWKQNENLVQCQSHFSEYKTDGSVIQGPQNTSGSTRALKIYPLEVSGNTLTATVA